jgi:hypothetical protein
MKKTIIAMLALVAFAGTAFADQQHQTIVLSFGGLHPLLDSGVHGMVHGIFLPAGERKRLLHIQSS